MLHDQDEINRMLGILYRGTANRGHTKAALERYAEHQAAPLETRILALEEALAVAHEAAIKADRKERGRIGNVSGNELYAMFSNAPVEPHPLLVDKS